MAEQLEQVSQKASRLLRELRGQALSRHPLLELLVEALLDEEGQLELPPGAEDLDQRGLEALLQLVNQAPLELEELLLDLMDREKSPVPDSPDLLKMWALDLTVEVLSDLDLLPVR
jgi:hypothetical protein